MSAIRKRGVGGGGGNPWTSFFWGGGGPDRYGVARGSGIFAGASDVKELENGLSWSVGSSLELVVCVCVEGKKVGEV